MLDGQLSQLSNEVERLFDEARGRARRELSDQLNQSVRRLRQADSLDQLAATLLDAAAVFAAGAAIFRIAGPAARGEKIRGVPQAAAQAFGSLDLPLSSAPALAGAVESRDPVIAVTSAAEVSPQLVALAAHAADGRAFIFPLVVKDRVTAVLYCWGPVQGAALEMLAQVAAAVWGSLAPLEAPGLVTIAPAAAPVGISALAPTAADAETGPAQAASSPVAAAAAPTAPAPASNAAASSPVATVATSAAAAAPTAPAPASNAAASSPVATVAMPAAAAAPTTLAPASNAAASSPVATVATSATAAAPTTLAPASNAAAVSPASTMAAPASGEPLPAEPAFAWDALPDEEQGLHLRARRFARVRVAEMRLYEATAVESGRTGRDLYGALRQRIDDARVTFRESYLAFCPHMADYLHVELVRTLAHDDPDLLGKDYPGPLV